MYGKKYKKKSIKYWNNPKKSVNISHLVQWERISWWDIKLIWTSILFGKRGARWPAKSRFQEYVIRTATHEINAFRDRKQNYMRLNKDTAFLTFAEWWWFFSLVAILSSQSLIGESIQLKTVHTKIFHEQRLANPSLSEYSCNSNSEKV